MQPVDEAELQQELRKLCQREGVMRENLRAFLMKECPLLFGFWHVTSRDSPVVVRAKVVGQLERLVADLKNFENQERARYLFNITGKPAVEQQNLGGRQAELAKIRTNNSASSTSRALEQEIAPTFAQSLIASPPPALVLPETSDSSQAPAPVRVSNPDMPAMRPVPKRRWALAIPVVLVAVVLGGATAIAIDRMFTAANPQTTPSTTNGSIPATVISIGPPPPGLQTITEQAGRYGAPTFKDPFGPSNGGSLIPAGAFVEVSCKVYAPSIQSATPDGYWYRIASAPWSNEYYAVANTFRNGDPIGVDVHKTDLKVPDCPLS